jgi:RNA polymerase sigma-70 factor, ECF subfamily
MAKSSGPDQRAASTDTDEELMRRYRDLNDQDAFDQLVHRYERELYRYLYRYVHDAQLAEEVFQSTFFRLHQSREQFQEGRLLRPWLYSIATHQAIDALRKAGRQPHTTTDRRQAEEEDAAGTGSLMDLIEAAGPSPAAEAENAERRAWMRDAVDQLPEHLRSVVLLVYFQGLKYSEAAEVLGISPGTVKSRLNAALSKLNAKWKQWAA